GFTASELRYALASAHYRQPLNFVAKDKMGNETFESLHAARQALNKLARAERELRTAAGESEVPTFASLLDQDIELGPFIPAWEALLGDLNTPDCLGKTFTALKETHDDPKNAWLALHIILAGLGIILPVEESVEVPQEIQEKAQKRWEAKQARDWATADALRDEVTESGWQIKDAKEGFEVVPAE
ncbi:MAG: cysteine--tRNA ligase, partial [Verrucomicrobiota bacterium]